jgi:hypothetical protein
MVAIVDDDDVERVNRYRWSYCPNRNGYAVRRAPKGSKPTMIPMARFIMNAPPDKWVDHIDGNTLDNRKSNLRLCTQAQNQMNMRMSRRNTSGYRGVVFDKRPHQQNRPWQATVSFKGKPVYVGCFATPEEAARAFDKKALELRGEFAQLNFPKAA